RDRAELVSGLFPAQGLLLLNLDDVHASTTSLESSIRDERRVNRLRNVDAIGSRLLGAWVPVASGGFERAATTVAAAVWQSRGQLAPLIDRDPKAKSEHVWNAERQTLVGITVVANIATTAPDGKRNEV
ncbi:hypothetical protein, partial [Microcella sp.]|uniref:hypothetical protein n=1 Tax=Microcella sp. TaxID=1913979 RepID=UPI00299F6BCF